MSKFISRSLIAWPLFASLAVLSACSDNDPANVSFEERDTSGVAANIVPNPNLAESDTEWTGWDTDVETSNGVLAEFALAPTLGEGGNSLQTSVKKVEVDSTPSDVYAGPTSVPVKPGQAYGVAAYVQGPWCGLTRFVVNPEGNEDPEQVLASQDIFMTGEPQMVEFYFQAPEGVTRVDMPVQMGFADNIGGEFFIDRLVAMPIPRLPPLRENNVANNSDFEESDTSINVDGSWGQSGTGATFTLDTEVAQNGNNSVRIEFTNSVGSGNPWDIEAGPIGVPVISGWTYTFSAWVKGDPGAKVNFLVQKPTANWDTYGQQEKIVTADWEEVRFEAKVEGTGSVRLYAQYNFPENRGATIYIDNIKLIPPATCPYAPITPDMISDNAELFEYDHVVNGSLENDVLEFEGWATESGNGAAAEFDMQIVPEKFNRSLVNKGNQSLRASIIAATANPADIQAGPTDLYVTPGKTYIYSAFARGPVDTKAQFTPVFPDAPSVPLESTTVIFDNIWQQISFDFTVPDDAPFLSPEELEEAGFPEDALVTRLTMAVNMSYPENEGKYIFLDDFMLLPNAVVNGDLEDSATEAQGWITEAPVSVATIAMDTADVHSGNHALRVRFTKDAAKLADETKSDSFVIRLDDVQAGIENIPVEGGRKYFVSARFKGDAGARVKLLVGAVDGSKEFASANGVELNGGWQEITFSANVPEGVEAVNLIAQMGYPNNALRTIRLDSFRLVSQIPPPPRAKTANVVSNSGFETGAATGWSGNSAQITVVNKAENPDGVYSGRYALYVHQRQADWASAQYDLGDSALTIGETYFASAWVKVDGADTDILTMTLLVEYVEGGSDYLQITTSGDADTSSWTRLSSVFTFTPTAQHAGKTVAKIKPYVEAKEEATNYFIDDLFITKVFNTNGGFEAGNSSEWDSAAATVTVVSDDAHSGTHSAYITSRTADWSSAQYHMTDIGLMPGRTYLLSAWVKTAGAVDETIKMTVQFKDESGTAEYRTIAQSSDVSDWVQLSNTFTYLPVGDVSTFKVYFETTSASFAPYYVDDLIITEFVPPASIITNGGLEQGNTNGWVGGGATIAIEQWPQGGAHSGFFGLRVSGRSQPYHSAQYPLLELGLQENTSYKASVWVKLTSESLTTDTVKLTLNFTDGVGQTWQTVAQQTASSDGWTKLEGVFDYAPSGAVTDLKLYVEAGDPATNYFVDDLVVAPNLAFNGGLEVSATDHIGWSQAGATLSLDADSKYSGERSLFVSARTNDWSSAQYDLTNSGMLPGKTYDISAWVKIEGDVPETLHLSMETRQANENSSTYTRLHSVEDTVSWVKLSARYHFAFDEIPTIFKVYVQTGEEITTSYYVDSLVITEVDEVYTH